MEAPKCKICGDRHYGQCRKFEQALPKQSISLETQHNSIPSTRDIILNVGATFDRTTYQREYMQKRRAAEKALKNKP